MKSKAGHKIQFISSQRIVVSLHSSRMVRLPRSFIKIIIEQTKNSQEFPAILNYSSYSQGLEFGFQGIPTFALAHEHHIVTAPKQISCITMTSPPSHCLHVVFNVSTICKFLVLSSTIIISANCLNLHSKLSCQCMRAQCQCMHSLEGYSTIHWFY